MPELVTSRGFTSKRNVVLTYEIELDEMVANSDRIKLGKELRITVTGTMKKGDLYQPMAEIEVSQDGMQIHTPLVTPLCPAVDGRCPIYEGDRIQFTLAQNAPPYMMKKYLKKPFKIKASITELGELVTCHVFEIMLEE
ncbi:MAG: ML domain-containing protein [Promethearchaeota archaeon]